MSRISYVFTRDCGIAKIVSCWGARYKTTTNLFSQDRGVETVVIPNFGSINLRVETPGEGIRNEAYGGAVVYSLVLRTNGGGFDHFQESSVGAVYYTEAKKWGPLSGADNVENDPHLSEVLKKALEWLATDSHANHLVLRSACREDSSTRSGTAFCLLRFDLWEIRNVQKSKNYINLRLRKFTNMLSRCR